MAYVIVHYVPFLIAAGLLGFLVGWWAMGSARRRSTDGAGEGDPS
ncbi:MAG: hypothetical protein P0Y66_16565 [Candidatus Kaistia colombiensis]|nr:MAG: hypothetical protein P0Y66_16565 [Kaistia sp.]